MLRNAPVVCLLLVACGPGDPASSSTGDGTGGPDGVGALWADGSYDGQPFSVRCEGDEIEGTRAAGDPTATTLSCTDHLAGFHVLLIALSPTTTTRTDCGMDQSLSITSTEGSQLTCLLGGYADFELAVAETEELDDGGLWWSGDFRMVMDDGVHSVDVVGGFDAASSRF